jgi:serine/threonine protein kinase HipA of HipAB toxin-antitoxin module
VLAGSGSPSLNGLPVRNLGGDLRKRACAAWPPSIAHRPRFDCVWVKGLVSLSENAEKLYCRALVRGVDDAGSQVDAVREIAQRDLGDRVRDGGLSPGARTCAGVRRVPRARFQLSFSTEQTAGASSSSI